MIRQRVCLSGDNLPATSKTKNRSALYVLDRNDKKRIKEAKEWFLNALDDLVADRIDSITVDVKHRTW